MVANEQHVGAPVKRSREPALAWSSGLEGNGSGGGEAGVRLANTRSRSWRDPRAGMSTLGSQTSANCLCSERGPLPSDAAVPNAASVREGCIWDAGV